MCATRVLLLGMLLGMAPRNDQAAEEIATILDAVAAANEEDARQLLRQAVRLLREKKLPAKEQNLLARRTLDCFRQIVHTPQHAGEVLADVQVHVSRQVYYRHYREYWTERHVLGVRIVFDCATGHSPVVRSVQMMAP